MARYGTYEVESHIAESAWVTTYQAHAKAAGESAREIRAFRPGPGVMDPQDATRAAQRFTQRAHLQETASLKSAWWIKVHEVGQSGPWPYVVADRAPWCAGDLAALRIPATASTLHLLFKGALKGLLDLKIHCGRGHGNLSPRTVVLTDLNLTKSDVLLTEPDGAANAAQEAADLRALGELIHLLVFHRRYDNVRGLPPQSEWNILGKRGPAWRAYCDALMGRTGQALRLADALNQLPPMPAKPLPWRWISIGAAAGVLIAASSLLFHSSKPTVSAEAFTPYAAAKWFHSRPASAPIKTQVPETVPANDPLTVFAADWDNSTARLSENDPSAILGKPVASIGSDPAQISSLLRGDAADRFNTSVHEIVTMEYHLGAVYQELDALGQYFAADPKAKDAPEDATAHWSGVQHLVEKLKGPDYLAPDAPQKPGDKALADYVTDFSVPNIKPMKLADASHITDWFGKIVLIRQIKAQWESMAPGENGVIVPPEEFFRLYVVRQIQEREGDNVDIAQIAQKLSHLADVQKMLRAHLVGLEDTVDWDRWRSTYRGAAGVTDEQEFTNWAENVAGFKRLVLSDKDKQKLDPARTYVDAAGKSLTQLRDYDQLTARIYTVQLQREKDWLSSWSDSRVRDENDRVVLERDRITFNPWFDAQARQHENSLAALSHTIADTLSNRIARLEAKQNDITTQATAWKAGGKLDRLCYDLLSQRLEFPPAPADPAPALRQKLMKEFDASAKSFAELHAAYRSITTRFDAIPPADDIAGISQWAADLSAILKTDRALAIQQAQDSIHSANELPVLDEAAFTTALKRRADHAAAARGLAGNLSAIETLADNMIMPDEAPPAGGQTIRALHERMKPALADPAFASAVHAEESELTNLLQIADARTPADLRAAASAIGPRFKPVCQLTLFERLNDPPMAEPSLLIEEPQLATTTLPEAIAKIPLLERRAPLAAKIDNERIARGYRRVDGRLTRADDASAQEAIRTAGLFKLGLPDKKPIRLSDMKAGQGTLQSKAMFNLMRYTLQQFCNDPAAPDIESVKSNFEEDLAALSPLLPKDSVTDLSAAMKKVTMGSVSMLTPHGPELAGWKKADKGNDMWEFTLPGYPPLLFKSLVGPDHRAFCLCTTATPLGLIKAMASPEISAQVETTKIQDLSDAPGPRVWRWDTAKHWFERSDMWLTNQSGVESHYAQELRGKELYQIADVHGGNPSDDHPMQYISIELSAFLSARLGCRLPSAEEWQAAYALNKTETTPLPNFRGRTFALQRAYVGSEAHPSIPTLLSTTWGNFDIMAALNLGDEKIESTDLLAPRDNGILWFSKVERINDDPASDSGHTFHHLLGNVSQLIVTQDIKNKLDALAPLNQTTRLQDPTKVQAKDVLALGLGKPRQKLVFVVGGSSLSAVSPSLPPEKPVAINIPDKAGWSDVGFRLAFTAEDPLSTKILDVLKKHGYLN